ncbi:MAG: hypothetical protein WCJ35_05815 [Planctomycetota bacterium]
MPNLVRPTPAEGTDERSTSLINSSHNSPSQPFTAHEISYLAPHPTPLCRSAASSISGRIGLTGQ